MKTNREMIYLLREMRRIYLLHPHGISDQSVAKLLRVKRRTVYRYRQMLAVEAVPGRRGQYTALPPDLSEIDYANAVLTRAAFEANRAGL